LKKAEILAKEVRGMAIPLEKVGETPYDVLINTTAVGMAPETSKVPIPAEAIHEKCTLLDVIQNPKETTFLIEGRKKHCSIIHGYEMYSRQAFQQQQLWQNRSLNENDTLGLIESFVFLR
jgi:shikimate dehydrogenase